VVEIMPDFSVIMTHTAGSCPLFKDETMKKFKELSEKREEANKKYEVKVVSTWSPTREHQTFWIVEAPSQKAVENYFKEIGFTLWNKLEIQQVKIIKK
jgi:molybdopterin-guanine dinucleotide biosynthesis protein A